MLEEAADPLMEEVSQQHVAKWRAGFKLADDNDFAFVFTDYDSTEMAGLAVAQAWLKAKGEAGVSFEAVHRLDCARSTSWRGLPSRCSTDPGSLPGPARQQRPANKSKTAQFNNKELRATCSTTVEAPSNE